MKRRPMGLFPRVNLILPADYADVDAKASRRKRVRPDRLTIHMDVFIEGDNTVEEVQDALDDGDFPKAFDALKRSGSLDHVKSNPNQVRAYDVVRVALKKAKPARDRARKKKRR